MSQSKPKTCIQCKHFKPITNSAIGICTNNKGYKEATAQGLPKPNKGQGYVFWFNDSCEDFKHKPLAAWIEADANINRFFSRQ